MTAYSELLRDPRWQKKRLEIMQRDDFTCQKCMSSEDTLNVHHCYYRKGNKPWEYDNSSLVTLCEHCHGEETRSLRGEKSLLLETLSLKGLMAADFNDLAVSIYEAPAFPKPLDDFIAALGWAIRDPEMRQAIIDGYDADRAARRAANAERHDG